MKAVQLFLQLKIQRIETKKEAKLKKKLTGNSKKDAKLLTSMVVESINELWPYAIEAGQRMNKKKVEPVKMSKKLRSYLFESVTDKFERAYKIYKIELGEPGPRAKEKAFWEYQKRLIKAIKASLHDLAQMAVFETEK